jgi:uncharacterized protein
LDRLTRLSPAGEVFALIALAYAVVFITGITGYARWLTYAAFLYLPVGVAWLRGVDFAVFGLFLTRRRETLLFTLGNALVVFPLFALGYYLATRAVPFLPWEPSFSGTPGEVVRFVVVNLALVALAEEFFYRGYLQQRLDAVWRPQWQILGARLGPGWLVASALFAVGHLGEAMDAARLATFIPGLWFGWARAWTGNIYAALVLHGLSNVLIAYLQGQPLGGG